MTTVNHYGNWVDSETPVTGVISAHSLEFLWEEIDYGDSIDLDYEAFLESEPSDEEQEMYESQEPTYLIGDWRKDPDDGKYDHIENGDKGFAAIVSTLQGYIVQVVWSKHTRRGALCSPCCPGQVDLDTPGEYLAYDLPLEMYGDGLPDHVKSEVTHNEAI